ncbi:phasin family protein [Methylobacterium sp. J-048]|uniref:phasin family protein n=1 Tax=Methylobacterium sp. J-048 TaxID=2836635 RepID=UPI001FBBD36D|nr:phasin family protein [Methylobacterium sp. J-048]MCJ2059951.1 phasin family protein [Methylobacterium sp. J-048]
MSKLHRPKGPRPHWNPKPAPGVDRAALRAVPPPTDTAIPDAAVSKAMAAGAGSRPDAAEPDPVEDSLPVAALVPPVTIPPVIASSAAPAAVSNSGGSDFMPDRLDVVGIGSTITHYMRGEGEAALAHLRALSEAGSPTELMRLQMGEVQRAADASLTCWSDVIRKASRIIAFR